MTNNTWREIHFSFNVCTDWFYLKAQCVQQKGTSIFFFTPHIPISFSHLEMDGDLPQTLRASPIQIIENPYRIVPVRKSNLTLPSNTTSNYMATSKLTTSTGQNHGTAIACRRLRLSLLERRVCSAGRRPEEGSRYDQASSKTDIQNVHIICVRR